MAPWGLEYTRVDMRDPQNVAAALRPNTRLVWIETPSNPLLKIADIAAIADIAHQAGALCAVDNTWATPVQQRPLDLGADMVMHATTKYIGGHSDVLGGAVVFRENDAFAERVRFLQINGGAVPSPFDCAPTLPVRCRSPVFWQPIRVSNVSTIRGWKPIPVMRSPPGRCAVSAA
jgi:cystathionine gamma-synthase